MHIKHIPRSFFILIVLSFFALAANAFDTRIVNLETNGLIFDPFSGMLYASVPGTSRIGANSVVPIDPATGKLGTPIFVGSQPGPLAISGDGTTLYVSLDGSFSVRRVDLTTMTAGTEFPLGSDDFLGPFSAEDIEVDPGNPDVIAVSLKYSGVSPRHAGVAIYENGLQRPVTTQTHTGSNRIEYSTNTATIYGYNNETTEFGFRELAVDSTGVTEISARSDLIDGFGVDIRYHSDLIYATSGRVIDSGSATIVGTYPGLNFASSVLPDSTANKVYFLSTTGIQVYDMNTFASLDTFTISEISGSPSDLVQWGPESFAFRTDSGQVIFVDTNPPDADGDGVGDAKDNCPNLPNSDQLDQDEDGIGDLCDRFPNDANHDFAQCRINLNSCLASDRFADQDTDGEHDNTDQCPDTPAGQPVDSAGCSIAQFCGIQTQRRPCNQSDWMNDEPGNQPRDCKARRVNQDRYACVPR